MLGRLWLEVDCRKVLHRHLRDRQSGFDAERAMCLTVVYRLIVSGSERRASTWRETVEIPGADAVTLDHACKAIV